MAAAAEEDEEASALWEGLVGEKRVVGVAREETEDGREFATVTTVRGAWLLSWISFNERNRGSALNLVGFAICTRPVDVVVRSLG